MRVGPVFATVAGELAGYASFGRNRVASIPVSGEIFDAQGFREALAQQVNGAGDAMGLAVHDAQLAQAVAELTRQHAVMNFTHDQRRENRRVARLFE